MTRSLFPFFADLRGRLVLVVGGGQVAARKIKLLLEAGARIRVGAPRLHPALALLASNGDVEHLPGEFQAHWLDEAWLAIAASDDEAVNHAVARAGEARRIWVNVVDDGERSSIHLPARVQRGALQVAISSGGGSPMLARHLRERLETQLDESLGELAALLQSARPRICQRYPRLGDRRRFFERVLTGHVPVLLRQGRRADAESALNAAIEAAPNPARRGRVALVGAGPGDPGLLTLRALRLLNEADVIVYDRLVSAEVLDLARRDAEFLPVGKQAGHHPVPQEQINALLVQHARAGKTVVRLKGGDPFVFGRGGEELQALRTQGIDYEVVPGVTAALACAAYAGVPLTHRGHAQSLRLLTAQLGESANAIDWRALAQEKQTLAVYMGTAMLGELRDRLIEHGRSARTPFALVENGSRPGQRVIVGELAHLPEAAAQHNVQSPALLILGEVAALAEPLHWFGAAPLRFTAAALAAAA